MSMVINFFLFCFHTPLSLVAVAVTHEDNLLPKLHVGQRTTWNQNGESSAAAAQLDSKTF